MTTAQKRVALSKVYDGPKWAEKVRKMSDQQVVAIYLRLKQQNKL